MSKLTQAQVKSGRWISASYVRPELESTGTIYTAIDTPFLTQDMEGTFVPLNVVDELLFSYNIYLYNILDRSTIEMNETIKLLISPYLWERHLNNQTAAKNLELVLTELLGEQEFLITVDRIQ